MAKTLDEMLDSIPDLYFVWCYVRERGVEEENQDRTCLYSSHQTMGRAKKRAASLTRKAMRTNTPTFSCFYYAEDPKNPDF